MGLLVAAAVLAPFVGVAGVLDWRSRRRRTTVRRGRGYREAPQRDAHTYIDIRDVGDG